MCHSSYVLCLGTPGRRRSMVRYLQQRKVDAVGCDEDRLAELVRLRGLPQLILTFSPEELRRARRNAPGLYEVGSLSFHEFVQARGRALSLIR